MKINGRFPTLTTLVVLVVVAFFMLAVPTVYAASSSSPRWDGLWMSGGLSFGTHSVSADFGEYLDLSQSGQRGFLDVKVGRGFSPRVAAFMHGIMSGTDSSGATINLMLRPTTASSIFVFGGVGYYNPGAIHTTVSAGVGLDVWRLSVDGRGFYSVGESSNASSVLLTLNYFWGRRNPYGYSY